MHLMKFMVLTVLFSVLMLNCLVLPVRFCLPRQYDVSSRVPALVVLPRQCGQPDAVPLGRTLRLCGVLVSRRVLGLSRRDHLSGGQWRHGGWVGRWARDEGHI